MSRSRPKNPPRTRQLWLVAEEGTTGRQCVADVAVRAPVHATLSYAVPDELAAAVHPGARVRVPFGRGGRLVDGLCVHVSSQPWNQTRKPIVAACAGAAWLRPELIALGLWVSSYYACPAWKTFAAILPLAIRGARQRVVRYLRATTTETPVDLTPRQAALLNLLQGGARTRRDALAAAGVGPAVLQKLCQRGLVEVIGQREPVPETIAPVVTAAAAPVTEDDFTLTAGQAEALDAVVRDVAVTPRFHVHVLFGVPGSGKTEVYVRAMRAAQQAGRQALLLIPEIALTTQLIARLQRRFARVGVLHSQLTERVRRSTLASIAAGQVDVVIGTRSAVFAPGPRLGLIVVDEEQEGSFKNLAAPFYHARDVAIKRGQLENIPVILGSATPALETWLNVAQRAHYTLHRLPDRIPGARPPAVHRVVTAEDERNRAGQVLSAPLLHELQKTLAHGQQAILLHNRRGYAVFLRCARCGLTLRCERCGVHLVYHRHDQQLKCHQCGRTRDVPDTCLDDTCGGRWQRTGSAIQRLEQELRAEVPAARLLRLDSDTMRRRDDYEAALAAFERGEADVLLGTQMVAKGLDFPRVRLVGVIEADAGLALPDFRAEERVFQLTVQVIGRAGRREGAALAVVQVERDTPVIRAALKMDYPAFARRELAARQRAGYPPARRMVRLVCADERPGRAARAADRLATSLRTLAGRLHTGLLVDDAEPCLLARLRNLRRYQVIVRGPRDPTIQHLLEAAVQEGALSLGVQRVTVDVDPLELL